MDFNYINYILLWICFSFYKLDSKITFSESSKIWKKHVIISFQHVCLKSWFSASMSKTEYVEYNYSNCQWKLSSMNVNNNVALGVTFL